MVISQGFYIIPLRRDERRFSTTRRNYHPQKTVNTNPNAFCNGVASSSGTPMPWYPSMAIDAVAYAAFATTAMESEANATAGLRVSPSRFATVCGTSNPNPNPNSVCTEADTTGRSRCDAGEGAAAHRDVFEHAA